MSCHFCWCALKVLWYVAFKMDCIYLPLKVLIICMPYKSVYPPFLGIKMVTYTLLSTDGKQILSPHIIWYSCYHAQIFLCLLTQMESNLCKSCLHISFDMAIAGWTCTAHSGTSGGTVHLAPGPPCSGSCTPGYCNLWVVWMASGVRVKLWDSGEECHT